MKDQEWYENRIKEIKKKKRSLTNAEYGSYFDGKRLNSKTIKEYKEDLTREKRSCKRAEKQQLKKVIEEEIQNWKEENE